MSADYQLLPPLSAAEYALLKADIRVQGVLVAVELDDRGHILDGHHRVRAWDELRAEGLRPEPYPRLIRSGLTEAEKRARVLALNLYRRHLAPTQRAAVLARIKDETAWSNRRIAELARVSEETVRTDLASVPKNLGTDASRTVGTDGKSYPTKKKQRTTVTARSDAEEQRALEALARLPEGTRPAGLVTTHDVTKAARPYRPAPPERPPTAPASLPESARLLASGEVEPADMPETSDWPIHLVLTSPPYGLGVRYADVGDVDQDRWHLFLYRLSQEAFRASEPSARFAINVPLDTTTPTPYPTYMVAVHAAVAAGWTYRFTIVWNEGTITHSTGRGSVDSASAPHVIAPVEMVAVFCKAGAENVPDGRMFGWKRTGDRPSDLTRAEWLDWTHGLWTFPGESRPWEGHPAAFPEELPRRLIKLLSFPGDTVMDPCMGSGTTGIAALKLGRRFIGLDPSPTYVESAKRRFAAAFGGA